MAQPARETNDQYMPTEHFSALSIDNATIPEAGYLPFGDASSSFPVTTSQFEDMTQYTAQAVEADDAVATHPGDGPIDMGDHILFPDTSDTEIFQREQDGLWVCNWFSTNGQGNEEEQSTSQTPCMETRARKCDVR